MPTQISLQHVILKNFAPHAASPCDPKADRVCGKICGPHIPDFKNQTHSPPPRTVGRTPTASMASHVAWISALRSLRFRTRGGGGAGAGAKAASGRIRILRSLWSLCPGHLCILDDLETRNHQSRYFW